jgi:hypothetical protein
MLDKTKPIAENFKYASELFDSIFEENVTGHIEQLWFFEVASYEKEIYTLEVNGIRLLVTEWSIDSTYEDPKYYERYIFYVGLEERYKKPIDYYCTWSDSIGIKLYTSSNLPHIFMCVKKIIKGLSINKCQMKKL